MGGDGIDAAARSAAQAGNRWRRAAAVGSLWAASEIVLGSFLHNLRVPFRGHLLTLISVALLSATRRVWPLPGIAWRAGLVAAVMKSVSPSAVLLGPMVAITMEGALYELGARLGRRGAAACVVGGAVAMCWTFLHQIGSLLIAFGPDLVEVYTRLVAATPKISQLPFGAWTPIAVVLAVEIAAGAGAGLFGWVAARGAASGDPASPSRSAPIAPPHHAPPGPAPSLAALAALVAGLPIGLTVFARLPAAAAAALALVTVGMLGWRDRRTLRRLARPGLWIAIFVVSAAAGLAFSAVPGGDTSVGAGIEAAVRLTARALFVVAVFSGIGRELAHPAVRRVARRLGSAPLMDAVETAFEALPRTIAALPAPREVLRRPAAVIAGLVAGLDRRLEPVGGEAAPTVVVLTGPVGSGKTTRAAAVADRLSGEGHRVAGVLAPGTVRDGRRCSFDVVDLSSGARAPLGTRDRPSGWIDLGGFRASPDGLALGRSALASDAVADADVVIVDEVGPWELSGEGWASEVGRIAADGPGLLLVVRDGLLDEILAHWDLAHRAVVLDARSPLEDTIAALRAALRGTDRATRGEGPTGTPTAP